MKVIINTEKVYCHEGNHIVSIVDAYWRKDEYEFMCNDCRSSQGLEICDKCKSEVRNDNTYWYDDAQTDKESKPFKSGKYSALCNECMPMYALRNWNPEGYY